MRCSCGKCCWCCPPKPAMEVAPLAPELREPPVGSWACVARICASLDPDSGFDWDAWKDEMKEREEA